MGNVCCYFGLSAPEKQIYSSLSSEIRAKLEQINFAGPSPSDTVLAKEEVLRAYRIVKPIGRGLFSKVYLATDSQNRKVALKVIKKSDFANKDNIKKIIVEKEVLKLLESEHILKLYRTIQTNTKIVFVLEYAGKGSLLNVMNVRTHLRPEEIRIIAAQLIEALLHIHSKGVIYGDLKAENVLIHNKGIVKLCDFNFSGTSSLLSDTLQGTVNYLAPEIISGLPRTAKSDFWALGVLLHLLFYKKFPFKSSYQAELFYNIVNKPIDPEPIDRQAPPELRLFINDLLCKNYRRRIGNDLNDFVRHKFFYRFNWTTYKTNGDVLAIVKGVPSFETDISQSLIENSMDDFDHQKNTSANTFHYDIRGFTYVNELPAEENASTPDDGAVRTTTNSYRSFEPSKERGPSDLETTPIKNTDKSPQDRRHL
jgi:serine/threonine protein kinase